MKHLKIINVNCRSVVKNRDRLGVLIETTKPDIIIGTESFLAKGIPTPTELSDDYSVERCDRSERHGGVFVASRKDLLMQREPDLETNCELVWCKIESKGTKTVHVGSFYRPDVSDTTSLSELSTSLSRIPDTHTIILGGDFNLPGCDWKAGQVSSGSKFPDQHQKAFDLTHDFGLTQHITETTRVDPFHGTANTLDLIMTNRPNSVISSTVLPGISDHDAPQIEIDVQPVRTAQNPRQIPNYKKADWDGFKTYMRMRGDSITNSPPDSDTEELWNSFRDSLLEGINVFIPHKTAKARRGLPYISREIRQLIRKRDRLYDKIKKTSKNVYLHHIVAAQKQRYKELKHKVQKRIRQAYSY